MQDNVPIHKAKFLIEFLREKEIETFNSVGHRNFLI